MRLVDIRVCVCVCLVQYLEENFDHLLQNGQQPTVVYAYPPPEERQDRGHLQRARNSVVNENTMTMAYLAR